MSAADIQLSDRWAWSRYRPVIQTTLAPRRLEGQTPLLLFPPQTSQGETIYSRKKEITIQTLIPPHFRVLFVTLFIAPLYTFRLVNQTLAGCHCLCVLNGYKARRNVSCRVWPFPDLVCHVHKRRLSTHVFVHRSPWGGGEGGSCDVSILLNVSGRRLDNVSNASYLNVTIWKVPGCNTDGNNRHLAVLPLTSDIGWYLGTIKGKGKVMSTPWRRMGGITPLFLDFYIGWERPNLRPCRSADEERSPGTQQNCGAEQG